MIVWNSCHASVVVSSDVQIPLDDMDIAMWMWVNRGGSFQWGEEGVVMGVGYME